ncbi:MAG TPA: YlmC/YmxH family sporulation protein [Limnochordales bacterium]
MRYSDLAGKEIIDIDQGIRLGIINDTDLVIDTDAGRVVAIIIPSRGGWWTRRELEIPWHGIRKIGVDLIIVDLSTAVDVHGAERRTGGEGSERSRAVWDRDASEPDLR